MPKAHRVSPATTVYLGRAGAWAVTRTTFGGEPLAGATALTAGREVAVATAVGIAKRLPARPTAASRSRFTRTPFVSLPLRVVLRWSGSGYALNADPRGS